ncbi:signal transduction histidine kinase [Streptomyces sp. 846.5]|nr:histidine kinase [Streptomyces sp. 846.5]TDU03293.1 signal transduction histidine kinase [Streptomyces sp. 846.5]
MPATPTAPLLTRLSPGACVALAWGAVLPFSLIRYATLPNGYLIYRPLGGTAEMVRRSTADLLIPGPWNSACLVASILASVAGCVLLRRRPMPAQALLLSGTVLEAMALTELTLQESLASCVALGFITAICPRRASLAALALTVGVVYVYAAVRLLHGWRVEQSTELAVALTAVVAWTIGNTIRQNRDHAETVRAQATARAVTEERLRIAREVHDMVAHSTGLVALQAGAASRVIETQPLEARKALTAIETTSRETLTGLQRTLGMLREAEAENASAPGLADVEQLAATTADAGVRVDVQWHGERRRLPELIDLSAFRIIQEAVTNVVRHADTRSCRVSVEYRDEHLVIEVLDSGRGHRGPASATGYGIVGMRERVGLLHGDFTAGPRPEGGFRVAARLPLPAAAAA